MSIKNVTYLYLHGGPGFSSELARRVLSPLFKKIKKDIYFWNEPSQFRALEDKDFLKNPDYWPRTMDSVEFFIQKWIPAQSDIHLIAHSFAAQIALELASKLGRRLRHLTFISPAFKLDHCHKRIIDIAINDFKADGQSAKVELLKKLKVESKSFFDEKIQEAMNIVVTDERLFSNYWENKLVMQRFAECLKDRRYQFDLDNFFGILRDMAKRGIPAEKVAQIAVPATAIFGHMDPVVSFEYETKYLNEHFKDLEVITFPRSRHWPHLEEVEKFMELFVL